MLQVAIRKYGREASTIELISSAEYFNEMRRLERRYIKELETRQPDGYNIKPGGEMRNPITTKVTVEGRTFDSTIQLCCHYNIVSVTYHGRRRRGWTVEQALSLEKPPVHSNASSIVVDGHMFESKTAAALHLSIDVNLMVKGFIFYTQC